MKKVILLLLTFMASSLSAAEVCGWYLKEFLSHEERERNHPAATPSQSYYSPEIDKITASKYIYLSMVPVCQVSRVYMDYMKHDLKYRNDFFNRAEKANVEAYAPKTGSMDQNKGSSFLINPSYTLSIHKPTHIFLHYRHHQERDVDFIKSNLDKLHPMGIKIFIYSHYHPVPEVIKNHKAVTVFELSPPAVYSLTNSKGFNMSAEVLTILDSGIKVKRTSDERVFRIHFNSLSKKDRALFSPAHRR